MGWNQPRSLHWDVFPCRRPALSEDAPTCIRSGKQRLEAHVKYWRGMSNVGLLVEQRRWFLQEALVRYFSCHFLIREAPRSGTKEPNRDLERFAMLPNAVSFVRFLSHACKPDAAQELFGDKSSLPACTCSVSSCALHNTSGTWLKTGHNHVRWTPELAATCFAHLEGKTHNSIDREKENKRLVVQNAF